MIAEFCIGVDLIWSFTLWWLVPVPFLQKIKGQNEFKYDTHFCLEWISYFEDFGFHIFTENEFVSSCILADKKNSLSIHRGLKKY